LLFLAVSVAVGVTTGATGAGASTIPVYFEPVAKYPDGSGEVEDVGVFKNPDGS
jgi:hypothetical protein